MSQIEDLYLPLPGCELMLNVFRMRSGKWANCFNVAYISCGVLIHNLHGERSRAKLVAAKCC
jgi:hypothetical protein